MECENQHAQGHCSFVMTSELHTYVAFHIPCTLGLSLVSELSYTTVVANGFFRHFSLALFMLLADLCKEANSIRRAPANKNSWHFG